jgi:invasion protein IalB
MFMPYRIERAGARMAGKWLAAGAAAVMLAIGVAPTADAQQQPAQRRPAQPAKPAQQPAPQAQPAAPAQQQQQQTAQAPQLIYSPWVKLCNKDSDPNAKRVCVTVKDGRVESGLLVVSVAIIEMEGEQRKLMRMSLPYGVALTHGTRMIVDQGTPATAPFVTCLPPVVPPGGCIADYEATADTINRLKKGQILTVQAIHMNGQPMSPQLDLKDFAKAYDGPPTDPKVFEEQQKKLQEELQKRAEEARKRLERETVPACPGPSCFRGSVQNGVARPIAALVVARESFGDLRMPHRLARRVGQQVLLRDVRDVLGFRVLRIEVVERLILARPRLRRDRQPPLLGVVELRVDVEDHAAERKETMLHNFAELELGDPHLGFMIVVHDETLSCNCGAHQSKPVARRHVGIF